jgi:hypothetical protein
MVAISSLACPRQLQSIFISQYNLTSGFTIKFTNRKFMFAKLAVALALVMLTGTVQSAGPAKETSIDLYCKSLAFGFIDTHKFLVPTVGSNDKVNKVGADMERTCANAPAPAPLVVATMAPNQIAMVACLGFSTGAQLAHQVGMPAEAYATLEKRRMFAGAACQTNAKKFQNDIFKKGPDYVLKQT